MMRKAAVRIVIHLTLNGIRWAGAFQVIDQMRSGDDLAPLFVLLPVFVLLPGAG
jgi:hypothetical protein